LGFLKNSKELKKEEELKWILEDKNHLVLRRCKKKRNVHDVSVSITIVLNNTGYNKAPKITEYVSYGIM
jgi:hypothetical protein